MSGGPMEPTHKCAGGTANTEDMLSLGGERESEGPTGLTRTRAEGTAGASNMLSGSWGASESGTPIRSTLGSPGGNKSRSEAARDRRRENYSLASEADKARRRPRELIC